MTSSRIERFLAYDESYSARIAEVAEDGVLHALAWLVARSGDSIVWLLISGVLIWQKNTLGWTLLVTVAVTAALTAVAKGIFRRQRPSEKWALMTDKYAFPSGHAARAGAVAVALSFAYPSWTLIWLLWAFLVALARVALARHYLTDVLSGLVFGIAIRLPACT